MSNANTVRALVKRNVTTAWITIDGSARMHDTLRDTRYTDVHAEMQKKKHIFSSGQEPPSGRT